MKFIKRKKKPLIALLIIFAIQLIFAVIIILLEQHYYFGEALTKDWTQQIIRLCEVVICLLFIAETVAMAAILWNDDMVVR